LKCPGRGVNFTWGGLFLGAFNVERGRMFYEIRGKGVKKFSPEEGILAPWVGGLC